MPPRKSHTPLASALPSTGLATQLLPVGLLACLLACFSGGGCATISDIVSEKPYYCTEDASDGSQDGEQSFSEFLEEDWRNHCERWRQAVESPGELGFGALTAFFGEHPRRQKILRERLESFDEPRTCFASEKEKLELRHLEACLEQSEASDQAMVAAFAYHAEPWVEGHALRLRAAKPKIGAARRETDRLLRKVADAYEYRTPMAPDVIEALESELTELDEVIEAAGRADAEHRSLLERAQGHSAITAALHRDYAPRVARLVADAAELREGLAQVRAEARFISYGGGAAGKPCPTGREAPKEQKIAHEALSSRLRDLGKVTVRIAATPPGAGQGSAQVIDGIVCGPRSDSNQFAGRTPQCGVYHFRVERDPGAGKKAPWKVVSFEESGPADGVDCAFLPK